MPLSEERKDIDLQYLKQMMEEDEARQVEIDEDRERRDRVEQEST